MQAKDSPVHGKDYQCKAKYYQCKTKTPSAKAPSARQKTLNVRQRPQCKAKTPSARQKTLSVRQRLKTSEHGIFSPENIDSRGDASEQGKGLVTAREIFLCHTDGKVNCLKESGQGATHIFLYFYIK